MDLKTTPAGVEWYASFNKGRFFAFHKDLHMSTLTCHKWHMVRNFFRPDSFCMRDHSNQFLCRSIKRGHRCCVQANTAYQRSKSSIIFGSRDMETWITSARSVSANN